MTLSAIPGGVRLQLHVQPGASRSEVAGLHGDRLKVRLAAVAVDGRANDALIDFLADRLGVARHAITIVRGAHARQKVVEVVGVDEATVRGVMLG